MNITVETSINNKRDIIYYDIYSEYDIIIVSKDVYNTNRHLFSTEKEVFVITSEIIENTQKNHRYISFDEMIVLLENCFQKTSVLYYGFCNVFLKFADTLKIRHYLKTDKISDTKLPYIPIEFLLKTHEITDDYVFLEYENSKNYNNNCDMEYIRLARNVVSSGNFRDDRTNVGTLGIFGEQMRFNIEHYIPILSTKRIPWKSCIEELLWFLKGDTNAKHLQEKGVKIWDGNSSREFLDKVGLNHLDEGDCGANYSFQWRHFGEKYKDCNTDTYKGVDQIKYVIDLIKNDPSSRRIFLSAWNPCDLENTVLPPCHVSAQFYVQNGTLSCHMYQRSADVFLGLPWNILSYSVLTYILAKETGLVPKELIISLGDTHIYSNHIDQIKEQIYREPCSQSKLIVNDFDSIENLTINDFNIVGYYPHPSIKGTMAV